jgi:hypothetical protein
MLAWCHLFRPVPASNRPIEIPGSFARCWQRMRALAAAASWRWRQTASLLTIEADGPVGEIASGHLTSGKATQRFTARVREGGCPHDPRLVGASPLRRSPSA